MLRAPSSEGRLGRDAERLEGRRVSAAGFSAPLSKEGEGMDEPLAQTGLIHPQQSNCACCCLPPAQGVVTVPHISASVGAGEGPVVDGLGL